MKHFILNHPSTRSFYHKFKEAKFKVKRIYEKWHNFLIRYQDYKIIGSLERLLQGICDSILKRGKEKFFTGLNVFYVDLGFLSLYMVK